MKKNIASVFLILGISFFVFLEFRIKFNNYNSKGVQTSACRS